MGPFLLQILPKLLPALRLEKILAQNDVDRLAFSELRAKEARHSLLAKDFEELPRTRDLPNLRNLRPQAAILFLGEFPNLPDGSYGCARSLRC